MYTSASQSSKPCPIPTPLTASPGSYSTLLQNLRPGLPPPTGDTDQEGGPKPREGYTGPFPGRTERQGAEQGALHTKLFRPAPHYRWVLCAPLRHTVWRKRQPHARKCRCPGLLTAEQVHGGVPFTASLAEREPLEGWGRRAAAGEQSRLNRPQRAQFQVLGEGSRLTGEDLTA